MQPNKKSPRQIAQEVIEIEAGALRGLIDQLDGNFDRAIDLLTRCQGRVVCSGMGKSGLIMKKVAATLSSTGTPALFLHPAEAVHGDLGMLATGDVVLAASYSGSTEELLRMVETLKRLGVPMLVMTGSPESPLARLAEIHLSVAIDREACPLRLAPTASTTATLALGDALAMALAESKGFTTEDFARLHPGGELGKRFLKVIDLMHSGDDLPKVVVTTSMRDALFEMSRHKMGITAVTDEHNRLVGCITDGDLRRLLEFDHEVFKRLAGESMTPEPQTIGADELASAALQKMEEHRITALFVCDRENGLEGIINLHDLWRLEMF